MTPGVPMTIPCGLPLLRWLVMVVCVRPLRLVGLTLIGILSPVCIPFPTRIMVAMALRFMQCLLVIGYGLVDRDLVRLSPSYTLL